MTNVTFFSSTVLLQFNNAMKILMTTFCRTVTTWATIVTSGISAPAFLSISVLACGTRHVRGATAVNRRCGRATLVNGMGAVQAGDMFLKLFNPGDVIQWCARSASSFLGLNGHRKDEANNETSRELYDCSSCVTAQLNRRVNSRQ